MTEGLRLRPSRESCGLRAERTISSWTTKSVGLCSAGSREMRETGEKGLIIFTSCRTLRKIVVALDTTLSELLKGL